MIPSPLGLGCSPGLPGDPTGRHCREGDLGQIIQVRALLPRFQEKAATCGDAAAEDARHRLLGCSGKVGREAPA